MRWQGLFEDLEAQLEAAEAAELSAEVSERARREAALVALTDRVRAAVGHPVSLRLAGGTPAAGRLLDAGVDWLLLEETGGREVLVPVSAVLSLTGLGGRVEAPASEVVRRLDLRWALRGLARSRTGVAVGLVDGSLVSGTVDRVGADHLDLAEHGLGEVRRAGAVRQVRLVPLAALALVRSGG